MPDPQTLQTLWQYMVHADRQLVAAAATVPEENDDRDFSISAGSVRKMLTHSYQAQVIWLCRLTDIAGAPDPVPTRTTLAVRWEILHNNLLAFAAAQDAASLQRIVHSTDRAGLPFALPVWMCMLHVADHATYHRGQLNSLIKLAGGAPSKVMLFSFAKEIAATSADETGGVKTAG